MGEEKLTGHEHHQHHELEPSQHEAERQPQHHEKIKHEPEKEPIDIEAASRQVEKEARSAKETHVEEEETRKPHHPATVSKKVKNEAYKNTLESARAGLAAPERVFSKIVHQPMIDKASEVGAKTIARPASLLSAGFIALIGSSVVLFMAHRYGFRYNLILFFALFVSGYFLGLIFEAVRYLVRGSKR